VPAGTLPPVARRLPDHPPDERAAPAVAVALGAGVSGAVQPEVNAALGDRLGSAVVASLVNFVVALAVTGVVVALRPGTRRRLGQLRTWPVPRWTFTAGLGGAMVVLAGAVTVDTIGVAVFSVAFFAGQIAFGLVVDRLGVAPGGKRPVTAARVEAVVLATGAIVLAQLGRPVGELEPALVAFAVAAGAAVAFQSAFNGRIAAATGDPVAATAVNVAVGTVALASVTAVLAATGRLGPLHWPSEPWLYVGGALGASIVLSLAVATAALGVLRATLTMLAAQLVAALVVDWVARDEAPTLGVVTGGVLLLVAAALVARTRQSTPWQGAPVPPPSTP
jgi:bacterial/archaeal transporter family-2 protein